MAKYHISEDGNPRACRAKTKCPLGMPMDEHFTDRYDARKFYEDTQRFEAEALRAEESLTDTSRHALTDTALTVPLGKLPIKPEWLDEDIALSKKHFGTEPEIIAVIPSPAGELAVVWEENSISNRDIDIQLERGFVSSRIVYRNLETGEEIGYLSIGYVDEASAERSWGNNEWSGLRYVEEFEGHQLGMGTWVDDPEKAGSRWDQMKVDTFSVATTPEEILEAKRKIWNRSHAALRMDPKNPAERKGWSEFVTPEDEAVIDDDLAAVQEVGKAHMEHFIKNHSNAIIDFSRVNDKYRGQGMGISLYVFAARKLAEKNRALHGSGIQTNEAQKMWARMRMDKDLPVGRMSSAYRDKDGSVRSRSNRFTLDFRKA